MTEWNGKIAVDRGSLPNIAREIKSRKLIEGDTPVRVWIKNSFWFPAKPRDTTWGEAGFFANVTHVQFREGDPAEDIFRAWRQGLAR